MSNVWGQSITLSIFGESHGEGIGIVIGGLPEGEEIDRDVIAADMKRRAPGGSSLSTARKEEDQVQILSGLLGNRTTGAPLCGIIFNQDTRSGDYQQYLLRPSHADFPAFMKYRGYHDYRGGGHFSGRLTAPLTFAGSVARQILAHRGVAIGAHIKEIGGVPDRELTLINSEILDGLRQDTFPVLDHEAGEAMKKAILTAKEEGDSVGGIIECAASGLPAGLGEPFFHSAESILSSMMFSIPGVKGIEFGKGFGLASMRGGEANDPIRLSGGRIVTATNHSGGINGGITNGMPVVFRVAMRPAASIGKPQDTVDVEKMEETVMEIRGRHDPCIVPRAVPVIESGLALCLLDLWRLEGRK